MQHCDVCCCIEYLIVRDQSQSKLFVTINWTIWFIVQLMSLAFNSSNVAWLSIYYGTIASIIDMLKSIMASLGQIETFVDIYEKLTNKSEVV